MLKGKVIHTQHEDKTNGKTPSVTVSKQQIFMTFQKQEKNKCKG